jgi:hypothetical protein
VAKVGKKPEPKQPKPETKAVARTKIKPIAETAGKEKKLC